MNKTIANKLNLYFGIILVIVFLYTGYYMREYLKPQYLDSLHIRMEYRANHIYILLIAIINIVLSNNVISNKNLIYKILGFLITILPIVAGILAIIAFLQEHTGDLNQRLITFLTIVLIFISAVLFLLNSFLISKQNKS